MSTNPHNAVRTTCRSASTAEQAIAVAYVYGPVAETIRATTYGPHFAVGISDHETLKSFSAHGANDVRPIEQVLAGLLEELPVDGGYDVVLATIQGQGEMWPAGLKVDYELRGCHDKARRAARGEGLRGVWYVRS